jgi:hypothetical protein
MIVARIAAVVLGVALVVWVVDAAIRTFMVPRPTRVRLTREVSRVIGWVFDRLAPPSRRYETRDRILALRPAITLLGYQAVWMFLVFVGFTGVFWGLDDPGWRLASQESGSALFTLGFSNPAGTAPLVAVYAEALIGLTLLALLISYLPTIYAAFQRREAMVAKLSVRGALPHSSPTPWTSLAVSYAAGVLELMETTMWPEWEGWFIDVGESHRSFPVLNWYRSPDPDTHWISAARTVLDMAALRVSTVDLPTSVAPHVTVRSGVITLRALATYLRVDFDPEPGPTDPISVTRAQYEAACDYLEAAGVPVVADRDAGWTSFAGWRVNYDAIIEAAARGLDAPPNPWDSVIDSRPPWNPAEIG